jgi:N-acylneuraminate cytidylyltransferase/CMP-N,N'-diacetyllegionaminic acid synthase
MRVLFVIAARGGSRSVPDKNLRQIAGISLVGFKALSARKSAYCSRLIISTDSQRIQEDARRYGVDVPFTRPSELAIDTAPSADVVLHAMDWIEKNDEKRYDGVMLLEPAAPFSRAVDYDAAVEKMVSRRANVVLGVRRVEINSVFVGPLDVEDRLTTVIDKMRGLTGCRRQDVPQEYTMNGGLYLARWDHFRATKSFYADRENTYGHVMEEQYSVEVDSIAGLHYAEFLVEKGYVDLSHWTEEA